MTAQDYLFQGIYLDQRLLSKVVELHALQKADECGNLFQDGMARSLEDGAKEFEAMIDLKRDLMQTINRLDNIQYRLLLEMRYLSGESWDEIAEVLGFKRNKVLQLHKRAIAEVEKLREGIDNENNDN